MCICLLDLGVYLRGWYFMVVVGMDFRLRFLVVFVIMRDVILEIVYGQVLVFFFLKEQDLIYGTVGDWVNIRKYLKMISENDICYRDC